MVDLRKAKPGDIYVDGYGNRVRILCNDRKDVTEGNFSVVALKDIGCHEEIVTYTIDGRYWKDRYFKLDFAKRDLVKRLNE